jgi:hypothetical protein
MPYITNRPFCTAFTLAKFYAIEACKVRSMLYICLCYSNSALLRYQQGLSSLVFVKGLKALLTCLESVACCQGRLYKGTCDFS